MSGEIRTEALIHDLAIVLERERSGYSPAVAASRIRDVLGITPGARTADIEGRLANALSCRCCVNNQCECVADPDDIACGELDQDGYAGLPSTGGYSAGRD